MRYIKGNFVQVPNIHLLKGQPPAVISVYFWICVHADQGGLCYPSRAKLMEEADVSEPTLDRTIKKLVEMGILAKQSRKSGKENLSNTYQIMLVDKGVASPVTPPTLTDEVVTISSNYNKTQASPSRRFFSMRRPDDDSDLPVLDADTLEEVTETPPKSKDPGIESLIKWAENERGVRFQSRAKQIKAINRMKAMKLHPKEIVRRWQELQEEKWYQEHGLDFASVASSFDRKPL